MIFLLQLVVFLKLVTANDHCKEGKCQTYALDIYGDAVENSEFVDHVFHKSPTINPIHCHSSCVDDCRCLSFNYKENNEEKVCELNEGSHFINQSSLTLLQPSKGIQPKGIMDNANSNGTELRIILSAKRTLLCVLKFDSYPGSV